jgi:DNA-binding MarR family transcriptional regulator
MIRHPSRNHKSRMGAEDKLRAFHQMPGHLIRRSKQKSTAMFMQAFAQFDVTPIQYAVLHILQIGPALDRAELCELVGLDNSTIGGVLARLKNRRLLQQYSKGRRHLVTSTPAARTLLARMSKIMPGVQAAILHPLTTRERQQLIRLLSKLVGLNRSYWRHPPFRPHKRAIAFKADQR